MVKAVWLGSRCGSGGFKCALFFNSCRALKVSEYSSKKNFLMRPINLWLKKRQLLFWAYV